jgi:hypothetical protein
MPLTDDELIRDVFNGTDTLARELAGRLERTLEEVAAMKGAAKLAAAAVEMGDYDAALDMLDFSSETL